MAPVPTRLDVVGDGLQGDPAHGIARRNYLLQKCGACGNELSLDAGDILEAGKWYHRRCWTPAEDKTIRRR
jgi:hypothetical protein